MENIIVITTFAYILFRYGLLYAFGFFFLALWVLALASISLEYLQKKRFERNVNKISEYAKEASGKVWEEFEKKVKSDVDH